MTWLDIESDERGTVLSRSFVLIHPETKERLRSGVAPRKIWPAFVGQEYLEAFRDRHDVHLKHYWQGHSDLLGENIPLIFMDFCDCVYPDAFVRRSSGHDSFSIGLGIPMLQLSRDMAWCLYRKTNIGKYDAVDKVHMLMKYDALPSINDLDVRSPNCPAASEADNSLASDLSAVADEFIFFHELSHVVLGHCDYRANEWRQFDCDPGFGEIGAEQSADTVAGCFSEEQRRQAQAQEIQADLTAVKLMLFLYSINGLPSLAKSTMSLRGFIRKLMCSTSLMFAAFRNESEHLGWQGHALHPHNTVRTDCIFSELLYAMTHHGLFSEDEVREWLYEGLYMANIAAGIYGLPFHPQFDPVAKPVQRQRNEYIGMLCASEHLWQQHGVLPRRIPLADALEQTKGEQGL